MGNAFENSEGDLVDRLLHAMEAAEEEGGDCRGSQSAAIKIASAEPKQKPWDEYLYDFRVYDSREPVAELKRLVTYRKVHDRVIAAHNLLHSTDVNDQSCLARAEKTFQEAVEQVPNLDSRLEQRLYYGLTLMTKGKQDEARACFKAIFALDPAWKEVAMRFAKSDPQRFNAPAIEEVARNAT